MDENLRKYDELQKLRETAANAKVSADGVESLRAEVKAMREEQADNRQILNQILLNVRPSDGLDDEVEESNRSATPTKGKKK